MQSSLEYIPNGLIGYRIMKPEQVCRELQIAIVVRAVTVESIAKDRVA